MSETKVSAENCDADGSAAVLEGPMHHVHGQQYVLQERHKVQDLADLLSGSSHGSEVGMVDMGIISDYESDYHAGDSDRTSIPFEDNNPDDVPIQHSESDPSLGLGLSSKKGRQAASE